MDHLNTYKIINPIQHGFRPGQCWTIMSDSIDTSFYRGNFKSNVSNYQVDLIMLNFSKVFDTVAHNKLLLKLTHLGIQSNTNFWIQTWLTSRTQKVVVEGETSNSLNILFGVPQGTVLGPLMFLL